MCMHDALVKLVVRDIGSCWPQWVAFKEMTDLQSSNRYASYGVMHFAVLEVP